MVAALAVGSALALLLGVVAPSLAQGTAGEVRLHWNPCFTGETQDLVPRPDVPAWLWASVRGHSDPHVAYEVWIAVGDCSNTLPDAWRFDAEGCQGPERIEINHLVPAAAIKMCPNFQGVSPSIQIKSFQLAPPHLGLPASMGVLVLAVTYPAGSNAIVPSMRYHLLNVAFDHAASVAGPGVPGESCGGLESPMTFALIPSRTNYVDSAGVEKPFRIEQGVVTTHGGCAPVPAATATWGAIKGQYRR